MIGCSKCAAEQENMETRIEGGTVYRFCSLCAAILKRADPATGNIEHGFLRYNHGGIEMTEEEEAMLEARLFRANGGSKWYERGQYC